MKKKTGLILALDVTDKDLAVSISMDTAPYVDAIKVGYPLILSTGLEIISELIDISPVIADLKVADIPNTNRLILKQVFSAGASAVIVHTFTGRDSLRACISEAAEQDCDVFAVTEMSHPGAKDFLLGAAKEMARMALECGVSGVVAPATRPDSVRMIREVVGDLVIISPGVGAQGGSAVDVIRAGADYVIVGRNIYQSYDPANAAKQIADEILSVL
jgi:orotidine-5'-phosphate decarboxylase